MQSAIQRFIENADYFVGLWHGVEIFDADKSRDGTWTESKLRMIQEAGKIRPLLATDGNELAPMMESAGEDTTDLIRFLNLTNSGGSIEPARILWPGLRVKLQRLAIKSAAAPDAQTTPGDDAYVPAGTLWQDHFTTYKQFKAFINATPTIRRISPSKNRLKIHAGDWAKYWAGRGKSDFANLDKGERAPLTPDPNDEIVGRFMEAQSRKKAGK